MKLEYAAGFFDGEGNADIWNKKYKYLRARIGNRNFKVINMLKKMWGGNIWRTHTTAGNKFYVWQVHGEGAHEFLSAIYPYLVIKQTKVGHLLKESR
jgi:hypothetical protein